MKTDIIAILQELDFTEYEAKAYITLLEKSPLSGYAISLNSGVPRSKIYEVLNGMVARGDILVSQENTPQYLPLSPEELIAQNLYAPEVPPLDVVVRTSGEQRLSNFMLWRSAYSEFIFIEKNWPDMTKEDVTFIMEEYARRQRRFGG